MGLPKESGFDLYPMFDTGKRDLITDVPGVLVGHATHHDGDIHTGVTAVLPRPSDWFRDKVFAGSSVIKGTSDWGIYGYSRSRLVDPIR